MATLQLPEGMTVRKVGNALKVVPMRRKKVAIIEKKEERMTRLINEDGTPYEGRQEESMEELNRKHEVLMAKVYAQRAAEKAAKEAKYTAAIENPPSLSGSQKQVDWASKIRGAYIEFYKDRRPEWCAQEVIEHTDAAHWIDNRYGMGVTNSDQREIQTLMKKY